MIAILFTAHVQADSIFKYTDESGRVHYVDDPSKIPEKYQKGEARPHALPTIMRENGQTREALEPARSLEQPEPYVPLEEVSPQEEYESHSPSPISQEEEQMLRKQGYDNQALLGLAAWRVFKPYVIGILIYSVFLIIAYAVLLNRGGLPGIAVIVPIYNMVLVSRLGGFSGWWILWCLVPGIGSIIWSATVHYGIATRFDKGTGFAIFTAIFPFLGIPILMFTADNQA